jgi:hypothetical protein
MGAATWHAKWKGLLQPRLHCEPLVEVAAVLGFPEGSSTGAIHVQCSDGEKWFIKTLDNLQENPTLLLNEYLVGRCGAMLGAPVCRVEPIRIPDQLAAKRPDGQAILPGVACGSLSVGPNSILVHDLQNRSLDDNKKRHCGILALCDWCAGTDLQWLAVGEEMEYHSHDHGHFLTSGLWVGVANLALARDASYLPPVDYRHLDAGERDRLVAVLRSCLRPQLMEALQSVPGQWPIGNSDLEMAGAFLEHRAPRVADALERLPL